MIIHPKLAKLRRKVLARHYLIVRIMFVLVTLFVVIGIFIGIGKLLKDTSIGKYASLSKTFILTQDEKIAQINNKTNILILGKSGGGHTAPDLTDTIMLASINHVTHEVSLVSLPRDIWIEDLRAKLNSIYYWGKQKKEDGGIVLAKSTVEEISGIPIHYAVVIDFSGFSEIIDAMGGIEVNVDKTFTDNRFPIFGKEVDECDGDLPAQAGPEYNCRYETITFEKGIQTMNGETALKFVRSRQSEDLDEGTDIARSARQQKVIVAIKDKALSKEVLFSPSVLRNLIANVQKMIETDLDNPAMAILARRMLQSKENIKIQVLPEELLVNPRANYIYDNLYVFVPASEDWSEIQSWFKDTF